MSSTPSQGIGDEIHQPLVAAYWSVLFGPEPVAVDDHDREGHARMEALRESGQAAQQLYQRRIYLMSREELDTMSWRQLLDEVVQEERQPRALSHAERIAHERWMDQGRTSDIGEKEAVRAYRVLVRDLEPLTDEQLRVLEQLRPTWAGTWVQLLAVAQDFGTPD